MELVKSIYLDYCGAKFKNVEQPKEDGNVTFFADSNKKGNGKKQNWKKFKGNCTVESRGTSWLIATGTSQQKRMVKKVQKWQKGRIVITVIRRSATDARRKSILQKNVLPGRRIKQTLSLWE